MSQATRLQAMHSLWKGIDVAEQKSRSAGSTKESEADIEALCMKRWKKAVGSRTSQITEIPFNKFAFRAGSSES